MESLQYLSSFHTAWKILHHNLTWEKEKQQYQQEEKGNTPLLNTNTHIIHTYNCHAAQRILPEHQQPLPYVTQKQAEGKLNCCSFCLKKSQQKRIQKIKEERRI